MRRLVRATLAMLFLLASGSQPIAFPALHTATLHAAPVDPALRDAARLDPPAFKLGNAARGFGWSTAIGDFNADGRPDAIIADRVDPRASGYRYRIQFAMSGRAPEDVTFESSRDAVAITVSDVDSDNDLDLVARAAPSGETVGLWLNDGNGHFTHADARRLPAAIQTTQTIGDTDTHAGISTPGVSSRRTLDALPAARDAVPSIARSTPRAAASDLPPAAVITSLSRPRAPPQAWPPPTLLS